MKTIFITGAQGFLGGNLQLLLQRRGDQTFVFNGDVKNTSELEYNLKSTPSVDFCFHFAGLSSDSACTKNPQEARTVNTESPLDLAKILNLYHPKAVLIFPSTGQVYASTDSAEIMLSEKSEVNPTNFYAETKLEAEKKLLHFSQNALIKIIVLRLFNHTHKSQAPQFFLPSIHKQLQENAQEIVTGDLELIRDIGAVQDLMHAFLTIIDSSYSKQFDIYNISSGTPKRLKDIAEHLAKKMKKDPAWKTTKDIIRHNEPKKVLSSSEKFQKEFSWSPINAQNVDSLVDNFLKEL